MAKALFAEASEAEDGAVAMEEGSTEPEDAEAIMIQVDRGGRLMRYSRRWYRDGVNGGSDEEGRIGTG